MVILDNSYDFKKHLGELLDYTPSKYNDGDECDAIARIMCNWCETQFGKQEHKWDYKLDVNPDPIEDQFMFVEEQHRTLFVLRWS